jgi:hypothetical protein
MSKVTKGAMAVAAVTTAQKVAKKVLSPHDPAGWGRAGGRGERWHVVTVNLPPQEVSPDGVAPGPLRELAGVEVRMQPAPADKGTEIAVRAGADADHGAVRKALREAKMLLETGEILQPDSPGSSRPTLLNKPLREATAHAREGGRL